MRSVRLWLGTVLAGICCGSLLGALLRVLVRWTGLEYLVVVRNLPYEDLFLRWWAVIPAGLIAGARVGAVAGTLLAAGAIVGTRVIAGWRRVTRAVAATVLAAGFGGVAGGLGYLVLAKLTSPLLPERLALQIGSPYRVVLAYGAAWGSVAAGLVAALVTTVWLYRGRRNQLAMDRP